MDLSLRARQTQHGESAGDGTWELGYRLCVYTMDLCAHKEEWDPHTHKSTHYLAGHLYK